MTPEQAEINRANSQFSTGPKTEAGKQRSSLNALRHGLTGQLVVMPNEDFEAYQHHLASFIDEYQPKGATEDHLIQSLADVSWRLNRIAALEANLLSICYTPAGLVDGLLDQAKALANLSLHSQRLSRQFERTVTQLRELQKTRLAQEKEDLEELADIIEMFDAKDKPYNPSDDGFVFTEAEIDSAIQARTRKNLASEAYEYHLSAAA